MTSLCFSVPETLRCAGLTREQAAFFLVPALIQGLLGLPLIYIKWKRGGIYWLFVLEGISYAGLSIMDYLVHTHAATVQDIGVFKMMDILIGALSSIPLLSYIVFLWFFSRATLFPLHSRRVELIVSRSLVMFVPIIVALNETSAFLNINYTTIPDTDGTTTLGVGFLTDSAESAWNTVANTTLVLIAVNQLVYFCFAFLHFFQKAYRGERTFSTDSERAVRRFSLKGTGWLSAGLKLGFLETILGFAGFGFAPTIMRRVLKVLARAFLLVGVCISPDPLPSNGEFSMFGSRARSARAPSAMAQRSKNLRELISPPRTDTFRKLDGSATKDFYTLRSNVVEEVQHRPERVTVRFDRDRVPQLVMRMSNLDFRSIGLGRSRSPSVRSEPTDASRPTTVSLPGHSLQYPSNGRVASADSELEAVQQLARQFPNLPSHSRPRAATVPPPFIEATEPEMDMDRSTSLSRKLSRRKPPPALFVTDPPMRPEIEPARHSSVMLLDSPPAPPRERERADSFVVVEAPSPPRERQDSFVMVSTYIDDDTVDYEPPTPSSGRSITLPPQPTSTLFTPSTGRTPTTGRSPLSSTPPTTPADSQIEKPPRAMIVDTLQTPRMPLRVFVDGRMRGMPEVPRSARMESMEIGSTPGFLGAGDGSIRIVTSGSSDMQLTARPDVPRSARTDSGELVSPWRTAHVKVAPTPRPLYSTTRRSVEPETLLSPFSDDAEVV